MKHQRKMLLKVKIRELYPWILSALALITGNWAADALLYFLEEIFKKLCVSNYMAYLQLFRVIYILVFIIVVIELYRQRRVFFPAHTKYFTNEKAEKRKHLVLFLSNLSEELEKSQGIPSGLSLSTDIFKDKQMLEKFKAVEKNIKWPWEMPIRAIAHHIGMLETITIICSEKSIRQAHFFLAICHKYSELKKVKIYLLCQKNGRDDFIEISSSDPITSFQGYDFESFDQLSKAIWFLLDKLKKKGYPMKEVMIDITGGQKPTSIVGASITFNQEIKAQYVQTNEPWEALSYDVHISSSDTGNFGL